MNDQNQQKNTADEGAETEEGFKSLDTIIQETEEEQVETREKEEASPTTEKENPHMLYRAHGDETIKPTNANIPRFRPETSDKKKKKAPKARLELPEE